MSEPYDFQVDEEVTILVETKDKSVGGLSAGHTLMLHLVGKVVAVEDDRVACWVTGLPPVDIDRPRALWFLRAHFINTDMHHPEVFLGDWIGIWESE